VPEYERCQWCGLDISVADIDTHTAKCVQKGEKRIFAILKDEKPVHPIDEKNSEMHVDETNKIIWLWMPRDIKEVDRVAFLEKVHGFLKQGYSYRWMLEQNRHTGDEKKW